VDATPILRATSDLVWGLEAEELAWRLSETAPPNGAGEPRRGSPYSLLASKQWRASAVEWQRLGWPYHQAEALSHSPEIDDQLAALDILDRLGAVPLAQRVRRRLRDHGDIRVPRGPASVTRSDPAGLTGRQQTVLALVAEGLTNAEIADRLVVSVRTVDSHVAAVLAKLGVSTRREAAQLHLARTADFGTTAP
jgi:DNA-binding CsgD family transcriptional regulator